MPVHLFEFRGQVNIHTIEAVEGRDAAIVDLPDAYLSTEMDNEEEVLMVLRGPLVNLMALIAPELYRTFFTINTLGQNLLYVKL